MWHCSYNLMCPLKSLPRFSFRPSPNASFFITIMVKAPVIQILSMLMAFAIVALEYPAPFLKGTSLHRSLAVRVVVLLAQAFLAIMYYQVRFFRRRGLLWAC